MDPDNQRDETPRSIADAVRVLQSFESAQSPSSSVAPEVRVGDVTPPPKKVFYKNKKLLIGAVIFFVALVGGLSFVLFGKSNDGTEAHNEELSGVLGIIIDILDGKASISSDGETWKDATVRSKLAEGDFVRTDTGTRMALRIQDGSVLRLDESTTVQLKSLVAESIQLEQKNGTAYHRIAPGRKYTVQIEGTSYSAQGGAFQTVHLAQQKGSRVLQGNVKVNSINVSEGKQYFTAHENNHYLEKITDIPLDELKSNGFLLWNLEQDEKNADFKTRLGYWQKLKEQRSADTAPAGARIVLSVTNTSKGTELSWTVTNVETPDGFKVVRSQSSPTPTFGRDEAQHVASPTARSYTWPSSKSGTFNYRVCVYKASESICYAYSNTVTIESSTVPPESVVSGTVNLSISDDMLSWTFDGTAPHGFKVLVSPTENPVYPKDAEYFGNAPYTLKLRPSGTYYAKVCKYTGSDEISGGCVDYSNQVIWIVP